MAEAKSVLLPIEERLSDDRDPCLEGMWPENFRSMLNHISDQFTSRVWIVQGQKEWPKTTQVSFNKYLLIFISISMKTIGESLLLDAMLQVTMHIRLPSIYNGHRCTADCSSNTKSSFNQIFYIHDKFVKLTNYSSSFIVLCL